MSYPAPPLPPPAEPTLPQTGRRLKRPYVCGVLALLMAAGVAASAFWPWLTPVLGGEEVSGWDIYRSAGDTGQNSFLIAEAFRAGFSPLFTGLSVVAAGGVLAAAALLLLGSPKVEQPAPRGIPAGMVTLVVLLGLLAFVPSVVSLFSVVFTQPRPYLIEPSVGLIAGLIFALLGEMMLVVGASGSTGRRMRSAAR
jgi:hypothetical protein